MFDLGDLNELTPRDLLKVTHVFVTHTHMDHFTGFDALLRIFLGRNKTLHLFGPPDFFRQVEGKLAGYTWNLVDEFENDFTLKVCEVHEEGLLEKAYVCRDRFQPGKAATWTASSGMLLEEPSFSVHGVLLDHRIPCLGLSLTENFGVNIIKQGLEDLNLPVGPWINRFKAAIYDNRDLGDDFLVRWEEKGKAFREKCFVLGDLAKKIARISRGRKITYITDAVGSPENYRKIIRLARGSDLLFIEAAFLEMDKEVAKRKYHLTAVEAGELAKMSGVKRFQVFHFSPRYKGRAADLEQEAREAYIYSTMPL